jgi:hypothetical protein
MDRTIEEPKFQYSDNAGHTGHCHLQIWEAPGAVPVAIVTEVPDNPGPSVMNAAPHVWRSVWEFLGRPAEMVMVEHYRVRNEVETDGYTDTYSVVTFKGASCFTSPFWRQLGPRELRKLIGREPV